MQQGLHTRQARMQHSRTHAQPIACTHAAGIAVQLLISSISATHGHEPWGGCNRLPHPLSNKISR
jgi:hypothetical protein